MVEKKKTTASVKTKIAIAVYTHWTFSSAFWSSKSNSTYEPRTGATTVPMPLNAWERLIRISEYFGGPQTVCWVRRGSTKRKACQVLLAMYGLAAVSSDPRPFPMIKMQAQKPPNECCLIAGIARRAPRPFTASTSMIVLTSFNS